ncbi:MAG: ThuA domain-containing protein [Actinomycetota bacterium]
MRPFRTLVAVLAALVATVPVVETSAAVSHPFDDVTAAWQIDAVDWLWTEGITTGVNATEFAPGRGVTRGEMAAFLFRTAGSPLGSPDHPFTDVVAPWQQDAVRWLFANGITNGVSADRFAPGRDVTRGEMAAFLFRAAGSPGGNDPHPFTDVIAPWQEEAVRWLYNTGITTGVSATAFAPDRTVTRGEMAAFLHRSEVESARIPNPPAVEALSVLVFTETRGFRHGSIDEGEDLIADLATDHGWTVEYADDSGRFLDGDLAGFDTIVFLQTTGDFFDGAEEAAFEAYIRQGGGFVGVHAAADAEYDWDWYGGLLGGWFDGHPPTQNATIIVEDGTHPSTEHLGATWERAGEWFDFSPNPRGSVTVLLSLDESTYSGGGMGGDHPIAWYHEYDGGRAWYTGLGHAGSAFAEPEFIAHLRGGIEWAGGR